MAFDLSFITRPQCSEKGAANQIHQKNAGTSGTTGTSNNGAGLSVPELQNKSGTRWDNPPEPEQNGQAVQYEAGAGTTAKATGKHGGAGNLSQLVPEIKTQSGTKNPSVYAAVPLVPDVPAKKASNPNEAATTQSNDPPPVSPHAARVAELAGAAYLHHFACKHCQAAGRGLSFAYMRCDTGRELWEAYQDAIE